MIPWSLHCKKKIIDPERIGQKAAELKEGGKKIVTLNGSFDLMHAGHLHMIFEASQLGDILIVALNTDNSIKKNKGDLRPIIPLEHRMQMMAALGFVDLVTWFNETDPRALLEQIQPHTHVNGSEYGENCIEAEVVRKGGGAIHIVQLLPELSTSSIVKKLVEAHK